eukprot:14458191-Ditylum_brightwellii.AAC.1
MVGNQYQKTLLPVSKFYNTEDEVDESKMNKMLDNRKKIDNATLDVIKLEYVLPSLSSTDKVDILETPDKETIPPPVVEIVNVKPEPTNHNINGNQVKTRYYYPIQVIIDDKINTKELMKIDSTKLKEKELFFSRYIDFTIHCAPHGIYILQIDYMEKDNTMGKDWSMKHVAMEKICLCNHMSAMASKLLKTDGLIAKELTELKSKVTSVHGDGYAVLYNIQYYMNHPNLIKDEVETSILHQQNSKTFTSYINQIQDFIQQEGLQNSSIPNDK